MSVVTFLATGMIGEYVLFDVSTSDKIILLILLFSSILALSSVAYMHENVL